MHLDCGADAVWVFHAISCCPNTVRSASDCGNGSERFTLLYLVISALVQLAGLGRAEQFIRG